MARGDGVKRGRAEGRAREGSERRWEKSELMGGRWGGKKGMMAGEKSLKEEREREESRGWKSREFWR